MHSSADQMGSISCDNIVFFDLRIFVLNEISKFSITII